MIELLAGQIYIVRTINGFFYTGSIIVVVLTALLLLYVVRRGDMGALWVFVFSSVSWILGEVYWVSYGGRLVTPVELMGGIVVSPIIPAVLRGVTDGALPVLLAYLFAGSVFSKRFKGVVGVLGFLVLYIFIEGFFETLGVKAGVLHPMTAMLGVPVWNASYSVRWLFNPLAVGGFLALTLIGLLLTFRRSRAFWNFALYYFSYLVIYTSYASLMGQLVGFKRWAGVPLISLGFNPETMSLSVLDPLNAVLRLVWISYGLPAIVSVYPFTIPICLIVPADPFRAGIAYFFDVTIEVAGIYLPFIAIPATLGLTPVFEGVSKRSAYAHGITLATLTIAPLTLAVWFSLGSLNFLVRFIQGAAAYPTLLMSGLAVLTAIIKLRRKT